MLNIDLNSDVQDRLKKLAETYKNNYNSLFNDFYNYNIEEHKRGMKNIELDLAFFEKKYSISTSEFYKIFNQGKYGDYNEDFIRWSGEYEIWLEHKRDLENLQ